jgi:hypothetical protein
VVGWCAGNHVRLLHNAVLLRSPLGSPPVMLVAQAMLIRVIATTGRPRSVADPHHAAVTTGNYCVRVNGSFPGLTCRLSGVTERPELPDTCPSQPEPPAGIPCPPPPSLRPPFAFPPPSPFAKLPIFSRSSRFAGLRTVGEVFQIDK